MRKKYVEEVTINKPYGAVIVDGVEELMRDEDFKSIAVYKLPGRDISFIACPDHESGIRFLEGIFKFIDIFTINLLIFLLTNHPKMNIIYLRTPYYYRKENLYESVICYGYDENNRSHYPFQQGRSQQNF